jgi:hypothetical protein
MGSNIGHLYGVCIYELLGTNRLSVRSAHKYVADSRKEIQDIDTSPAEMNWGGGKTGHRNLRST